MLSYGRWEIYFIFSRNKYGCQSYCECVNKPVPIPTFAFSNEFHSYIVFQPIPKLLIIELTENYEKKCIWPCRNCIFNFCFPRNAISREDTVCQPFIHFLSLWSRTWIFKHWWYQWLIILWSIWYYSWSNVRECRLRSRSWHFCV